MKKALPILLLLLGVARPVQGQVTPSIAFAPGYHRDTSTDAGQMTAYFRWASIGQGSAITTFWPGGIIPIYLIFETAGANTWSTAVQNLFASFWNHMTPGRVALYNAYRPFSDANQIQGFRTGGTCVRHSSAADTFSTVLNDCHTNQGMAIDNTGMYFQMFLDSPAGGCSTHSFGGIVLGTYIIESTICDLGLTAIVTPSPNSTLYDEVFWRMTGEGQVGMFEARGFSCISTFSNPPTDNRGCYQYTSPWWNAGETGGYGSASVPTPGELCGSDPPIITGFSPTGLVGSGYYNYSWVDGPTTYYVQINRFWTRSQGGYCEIVGPPSFFTTRCARDSDCPAYSNYCDRTSGWCNPPSGIDLRKNGYETDVDCGGDTTFACGSGKHCNLNPDCASGTCTAGVCN